MKNQNIDTLEMRGIYKEFPGVVANNYIDLQIKKGEIVSLLGENGAGKTTLMNILYGLYRMDKGEIYINNEKVNIRSPRDAINKGIGMVHQHFMLIDNHSVLENISLYLKETPILFPEKKVEEKLLDFFEKYGFYVNHKAKIYELSLGEQQRVEIIKILLGGASLIILDEPTSVLTPKEVEDLFNLLRNLVKEGKSVIFITHKLKEVFEISTRVVVLRQGKKVFEDDIKNTNENELARHMVEREIKPSMQKKEIKNGEIILSVKDLFVKNDKGRTVVKGVNFEVKEYEIFGIAGVSGNGQKELIEALTGLRKWEKGEVQFFGKKYDRFNSKLFRKLNISHIPEERTKFGVVANLPIYDNSVLRTYDNCNFCRGLILRYNNIKDFSKKIIKEYNVMAPSINTRIKFLSGGNIQKFILGREISTKKDFIIAAHPTYGLDISATRDIRDLLIKMRDEGSGILLVSEDLDEILEISDRFAIMYDGEFIRITKPGELSIEEIGLMLGGLKNKNREEKLS